MTNKELKRMSRAELLEILLTQTREVERLQESLAQAEQKLADQRICIEEAGSIAQAALQLNGVFEAAQAAADQFLRNASEMEERTRAKCQSMEEETQAKCREMIHQAEQEASRYWEDVREQIKDPFRDHMWWISVMKDVNDHIQSEA